jgi:hypothetical protein
MKAARTSIDYRGAPITQFPATCDQYIWIGVGVPSGESDKWKEIARHMTLRYVGDVDPEYYKRTAKYPRWLIRVMPEEMITWRGGGWHRRYT